MSPLKFKSVFVLTFLVTAVLVLVFQLAQAAAFVNNGAITIHDNSSATPYPSTITVAGLPGVIDRMTVTLYDIAHDLPDDVDVLLESPSGETVLLLSDVGGVTAVSGITITLDDTAAAALPDAAPLTGGAFRPTNFGGGDILPLPAPIQPYATDLAAFNGSDPNGTWRLYVQDDFPNHSGVIAGGWDLELKMAPSSLVVDFDHNTINEGGVVTLIVGSFVDPDTADAHTVVVDWGDGSPTMTIDLPPGSTSFGNLVNHAYPDDDPTGTAADVYPVTVTVTDPDGGVAVSQSTILVKNVAPVLTNLDALSVNEDSVTTLTGNIGDAGTADTFTMTVDWDDGDVETFAYPAGTAAFAETHRYKDDDPNGTPADNYTVAVTLVDDDAGSDVGSTDLVVSNTPPLIGEMTATPGVVGEPVTFTAVFTDTGRFDNHSITWDFGDGATFTETLTDTIHTTYSLSVPHPYLAPGNYTVIFSVVDDDSGQDVATLPLQVNMHLYLPVVFKQGR